MVRAHSGEKISGRPDLEEQRLLTETVGARLRKLRAEYKLSIRDLERRSGVSRSSISLLERGLRRPRESTLGWPVRIPHGIPDADRELYMSS